MYKIGEFSKITKLSIKTLRYYDSEKILEPSFRNEDNNYRYYNNDDFEKAELIILLRELDFSIAEIKDVILIYRGKEDLPYIFKEKTRMIEERILQQKELLKKLTLYENNKNKEEQIVDYKIGFKELPEVTVATMRYKGKYSDMGIYIKEIYKEVKGKADGAPFAIYYDREYRENADIEICVPIKKLIDSVNVNSKIIKGVKGISTIHNGEYSKLNLAYKAIFDYANENNIKCDIPTREFYKKGPGMIFKGNPEKYITEIFLPIEE